MKKFKFDPRQYLVNIFTSLKLVFVLFGAGAFAAPLYSPGTNVRALGMGNAYIGVVRDVDAIFYNPAGLSRIGGFNWTILDAKIGASGYEAFESISESGSGSEFADQVNALFGKNVGLAMGAKTAFSAPGFAVAIYDSLEASIVPNNPVFPTLEIDAINDYGYAVGIGLPFIPAIQSGVVLKRIDRIGSRIPLGGSLLSELDPDTILNNIQNRGVGYALDVGFNFMTPGATKAIVGVVWKNIGRTTFKPYNQGGVAPPSDPEEIHLGFALDFDLPLLTITPAMDFNYINRPDIQIGKKLNMGLEFGLPFLDFRAGFHQGYYALGLGLNMGIIRTDLATYGVELGEYPGQIEDRRYLLQMTLELGFDAGFNFTGGGEGGGGKRSIWGGRKRLKQRR